MHWLHLKLILLLLVGIDQNMNRKKHIKKDILNYIIRNQSIIVCPSDAIDVYPWYANRMCNGDHPGDRFLFCELSEHIKKCADILGIKIEWGGDWKKFIDFPHWQLKK